MIDNIAHFTQDLSARGQPLLNDGFTSVRTRPTDRPNDRRDCFAFLSSFQMRLIGGGGASVFSLPPSLTPSGIAVPRDEGKERGVRGKREGATVDRYNYHLIILLIPFCE